MSVIVAGNLGDKLVDLIICSCADVERMVDEIASDEEEHGKNQNLLDNRHGTVCIYSLRDFDQLHQKCESENRLSDDYHRCLQPGYNCVGIGGTVASCKNRIERGVKCFFGTEVVCDICYSTEKEVGDSLKETLHPLADVVADIVYPIVPRHCLSCFRKSQ